MAEPDEYLTFSSPQEWRTWLEVHHVVRTEAWLVHIKKGVDRPGLRYEEAVEEAVCFGWIDGLLHGIDAETFALRYSPRKRDSVWSASNIQRVEKLIGEGRMTPAGMAAVAAAQANGQWQAAQRREDVDTIPDDLEQALRQEEGALAAYQSQPASRKKQWLYWLESARRSETRARRIEAIVDSVRKGL